MTAADISGVIGIHWTHFRAASGRRFLERAYYPTLIDPASTGFGFVETLSGNVIGFLAGALDSMAFHKALLNGKAADCLAAAARLAFSGLSSAAGVLRPLRYMLSGSAGGKGAWIYFVAVAEGHRNQGIAERLVAASVAYCRSRGIARCRVRTLKTNVQMQRVLEKTGFRVQAAGRGNAENRFIYVLDLGTGVPR